MEACKICGASAFEECEIDCENWDSRFDEIHDFAVGHYSDLELPQIEDIEWK